MRIKNVVSKYTDGVTRLANSECHVKSHWWCGSSDQTRGAMSQRARSQGPVRMLRAFSIIITSSSSRLRHASIIFCCWLKQLLFFFPSFLSLPLPPPLPDMPPNTSRYQHTTEDATHIPPNESLNQLIEATPFIDYEVASSSLFDGAFTIVSTIFPSWQRQDLKLVQCKDGITNQCM